MNELYLYGYIVDGLMCCAHELSEFFFVVLDLFYD